MKGNKTKLYSYVIPYDDGFAPNPFFGYCTLACCKPDIRRCAKNGNWVVGTGSLRTVGVNKMVYAMKVKEVLSFDEYSRDKRFANKKPSPGIFTERGDNIYFYRNGKLQQHQPAYHSEKNKKRDVENGKNVLVSKRFIYFGREAIKIPKHLRKIQRINKDGKPGQMHNVFESDDKIYKDFIKWIEKVEEKYGLGVHGAPYTFKHEIPDEKKWRSSCSC